MNWKSLNWMSLVKMEKFTKPKAIADANNGTVHDRPLRPRRVAKWVEIYNSGHYWPGCPTQAPLIYSPNNKRLNGQTRLMGFIESNLTSVTFPIIRGLPEEAFPLLDLDSCGRAPKDANYDLINVTRNGVRINWLHALIVGDRFYLSPAILMRQRITMTYREEVEWASGVLQHTGLHHRAPYAVPFMYILRCDKNFTTRMAKQWVSGALLPQTLVNLRDEAQQPTRQQGVQCEKTMRGGGRLYTHEGPTFAMFNALRAIHEGRGGRVSKSSDMGFRYWSELRKDGAWERYITQAGAPKKTWMRKQELDKVGT